mmetsp:Transcript_26546/g.69795  ORF Transcript_26546/g.69795 Transcript_26546/m.69795 type:complete len:385 (+) Transcript_26546:68-1222(+)
MTDMDFTNSSFPNITSVIGSCGEDSSGSSTSSSFASGVLVAFLGSTFEQLGLTLWKLADNRVQKRRELRKNILADDEHVELATPSSHRDSLAGNVDDESVDQRTLSPASKNDMIEVVRRDSDDDLSPSSQISGRSFGADTQPEDGIPPSPRKPTTVIRFDSEVEEKHIETDDEENETDRLESWRVWCVEKEIVVTVLAAIVYAAGNGLNFVALGLIQESIVTLIGAWALVINIVTAKYMLGEELSRLDGVAVILIAVGIALSIFGSHHSTTVWCIKRLVTQYKQLSVIILIIMNLTVIISLISFQFGFFYWRRHQESQGILVKMRQSVKFSYMMVGAQISWFTVLFGKSFSTLIVQTAAGDNQFTDPFVFIIVIAFLISLPSQL